MLNRYVFSNPIYKKHRELLMLLMDLFVVCYSFLFALWIKGDFTLVYFKEFTSSQYLWMTIIILLIYTCSFLAFKINKTLWKFISVQETVRIGEANILSALCCLVILSLILNENMRALGSLFLVATILSTVTMFGFRAIYRLIRRASLVDNNGKRVLIIGAGSAGSILHKEFIQNPDLGYYPVGFVDDSQAGRIVSGLEVFGDVKDLEKIVEEKSIEALVIAMPSVSKERIREIYEECIKTNLPIKIMNNIRYSFNDSLNARIPVEDVKIEDLLGRGEVKLHQNEIASYLTHKKVLVTGAGGSIGSELCRQIMKFQPDQLIMVDMNENGLYMLEQEFNRLRRSSQIDANIKVLSLVANIREYSKMLSMMNEIKPDVVYHAAAHKHVPLMETSPKEAIKNNVFGTYNVIRSCIEASVSRFIMISTDKAVNPTNVMGATKRMTEMILQAYGNNGVTKMAAVRFGNVLGSNGSVIPIFKEQIKSGGPVTITDKNITRYFMTIPEAAQLVLQAGFYADKGEIFVLDMGEPVKIIDLAEKLIRLSGLRPYEDIEIKEIGLRPGEKMYEELSLGNEKRYKTKNDLIFVNEVMDISLQEIEEKLKVLQNCLDSETNPLEVKNVMLDSIKDKEFINV